MSSGLSSSDRRKPARSPAQGVRHHSQGENPGGVAGVFVTERSVHGVLVAGVAVMTEVRSKQPLSLRRAGTKVRGKLPFEDRSAALPSVL